jgi:hypothetical protein
MTTNHDEIAKEYQASKLQPWRTHIQRQTLLRLTGDVRGLRNLDWQSVRRDVAAAAGRILFFGRYPLAEVFFNG